MDQYLLRLTTEDQCRNTASPMRGHHNQVASLGLAGFNDSLGRFAYIPTNATPDLSAASRTGVRIFFAAASIAFS